MPERGALISVSLESRTGWESSGQRFNPAWWIKENNGLGQIDCTVLYSEEALRK